MCVCRGGGGACEIDPGAINFQISCIYAPGISVEETIGKPIEILSGTEMKVGKCD